MKVGIITWHYFDNVGSNLQAYALQETIKNLGHDVQIIDHRKKHLEEKNIKKLIKNFFILLDDLFPGKLSEKLRFGSQRVRNEKMQLTKTVHTKKELQELAKTFDAVICGSDQIWAPNCFDDIYMLSFVDDATKKIAYAPSIGLNDIPSELRNEYKKWVGRIDSLSVRENKGVELLKNCCELEATQVVDPTLLLDAKKWDEFCEKETVLEGDYVFSYLLGDKPWIRERIQKFAKEKGMKLVIYSQNPGDAECADVYYDRMGSPKFLKTIQGAKYVLTDSFHGLLFSVQFQKNVYVLDRFDEDEALCQNSRVESVVTLLGIKERRVSRNTEIKDIPMDYPAINKRIEEARKQSLDFLKGALEK